MESGEIQKLGKEKQESDMGPVGDNAPSIPHQTAESSGSESGVEEIDEMDRETTPVSPTQEAQAVPIQNPTTKANVSTEAEIVRLQSSSENTLPSEASDKNDDGPVPSSQESQRSFQFLRLPYDIRSKIYDELFAYSIHPIEPDITREFWRHGNLDHSCYFFLESGATAFLVTCKQVNSEASDALYGSNTFTFNDRGHLSAFEGCINRSGCHGSDHLQTSSITSMYLFLRLIGKANRLRLRFIEVELARPQSCYYPDEIAEDMEFFTGPDMPVGGQYLGKSLGFLAQGHNLSMLRVKLNDEVWAPEWYKPRLTMWMHLFRDPAESQLVRHLKSIKGLVVFRCDPEEAFRTMVERKEGIKRRRGEDTQLVRMTLEKEYVLSMECYSAVEMAMMGRSSFRHRDEVLSLAEELDIVQSKRKTVLTEMMDGIDSAEKIAVDIINTVEKETSEKTSELRKSAMQKRMELENRAEKIALEMKKLLVRGNRTNVV